VLSYGRMQKTSHTGDGETFAARRPSSYGRCSGAKASGEVATNVTTISLQRRQGSRRAREITAPRETTEPVGHLVDRLRWRRDNLGRSWKASLQAFRPQDREYAGTVCTLVNEMKLLEGESKKRKDQGRAPDSV